MSDDLKANVGAAIFDILAGIPSEPVALDVSIVYKAL